MAVTASHHAAVSKEGAGKAARIGIFLVILAVASTVFNDLPELLPAGEMSRDPFVLIFPLLLLYHLARKPGDFHVSITLSLLAIALFAVIVASVTVNYSDISTASFKGRSGMSRVFSQGLIFMFGLVVAFTFYHVTVLGQIGAVSRGARIGLLIMSGVGLLEFGSWFSLPVFTQLYDALSLVIHFDTNAFYPMRLRTTAFEVSWAAVMLTFIFPFAVAGVSGWYRAALMLCVLMLAVLAQSRTAMLVIGFQFVIFFLIACRTRMDRLFHLAAVGCVVVLCVVQIPGAGRAVGERVTNLIEYGSLDGPYERSGGDENVSNITRLAHVRIGFEIFRDNPVLGSGLGQYGFKYSDYVRATDLSSWEVRAYLLSGSNNLVWPPTYSNHVRLLAELGLSGYVVWLAMVLIPLLWALKRARADTAEGRYNLAIVMTLVGWILLGASIDSFRFFGGWIALGSALGLLEWPRRGAQFYPVAGRQKRPELKRFPENVTRHIT